MVSELKWFIKHFQTTKTSCKGCIYNSGAKHSICTICLSEDFDVDGLFKDFEEWKKHNDVSVSENEESSPEKEGNDLVNHPKHYCRDNALECIDEMKLVFGKKAVKHFCLCNVWKYRYRANDKNGKEDISKSDRYIKKYKSLKKNKKKQKAYKPNII